MRVIGETADEFFPCSEPTPSNGFPRLAPAQQFRLKPDHSYQQDQVDWCWARASRSIFLTVNSLLMRRKKALKSWDLRG